MQDYNNPYSPPKSENDFIPKKPKHPKTGEQVRSISFLEWLIILIPNYVLSLMLEKSVWGLLLLLLPFIYIFTFKNKNITNYFISLFIISFIILAIVFLLIFLSAS